ncbi:DUF547 domain-containing protein [Stappia sp.]|uniref:DUF547 domain-containing protein n=1 Tax=Stappia sp. TaxID=1870903 RepID=UPI003D0E16DF
MRHVAGCPAEGPPHTDEHAFGVAAPVSRRSLVAGLGAAFLLPAGAARAAAPSHGPFTDLLQRYVVAGRDGLNRVRYARFKAEAGGSLDRYIASLAATRVSGLGRDDAFAFWVNLYNAVTLQVVLAHYPVRSIREIDLGGGFFARGPWRKNLVAVEGRDLSLDDIEHGILRKRWSEPRVHYAVNCASIGCPNLAREAWSGATLERMLDEGARAFINHRRGVAVTADGVRASRIYSWFSEDFGTGEQLREHWRAHAGAGLRRGLDANPRIAGYDYDWGLNDAG